MADVITIEQAIALLHRVDEENAQVVALEMQLLATDAGDLVESQQAYHQALGPAGADIDDDALAATADLQTATSAVEEEGATASRIAGEVTAHIGAALQSLGSHSRLSEAVQAHPGAARMGFYRPA